MGMRTPENLSRHADRLVDSGICTVTFHIGLHKTATKWLQRRLFPAIAGLDVIEADCVPEASARIAASRAGSVIVSHERMSGMIKDGLQPGTSTARLGRSLADIASLRPEAGIVIGFREHGSWINSAYAQRAKKRSVSPHRYLAGFSAEDLSWCGKLGRIEAACPRVFPFLYEELAHDPAGLIADLCRFINVAPPDGVQELVQQRENLSPRSRAGQFVSQPFHRISRSLGHLPGLTPGGVRDFGVRLGARLDRAFPGRPQIHFDEAQRRELERDWADLLSRVEALRGRRIVTFSG